MGMGGVCLEMGVTPVTAHAPVDERRNTTGVTSQDRLTRESFREPGCAVSG